MKQSYMLYDGLCLFCGKARKIVTFLDWFSAIKPINAYDAKALAEIKRDIPDIQELLTQIHLLDKNGTAYTGFYAVRRIALKLPLTAPFAVLLYLPGIHIVGQKIYLYIAQNKQRFS